MLLRALFPALILLLAHQANAAPSSRQELEELENESAFHQGMNEVFADLIALGGDKILAAPGSSRDLSLSALRRQIPNIRFRSHQGMITLGTPDTVRCSSDIQAHWFTAADSPRDKRPLIVHTRLMKAHEFSSKDWTLFFHETLSALGITDDEYQVSSPLLLLAEEARASRKAMPLLAVEPPFLELVAPLKNVKTHLRAPKFITDAADLCLQFPAEGGRGVRVANKTGIGGGGYGLSLVFKKDLLLKANNFWESHNERKLPETSRQQFVRALQELGVEPLHWYEGGKQIFPPEVKYGKSKRTGKFTAYLYLDDLYPKYLESLQRKKLGQPEQKSVMQMEEDGDFVTVTGSDWLGALELVYRKIYKEKLR